jgi:hypothetical protein
VVVLAIVALLLGALPFGASAAPDDPRFFPQTGFRIDNDAFFAYFRARGGVANFGYPVSRAFTFKGFTVQIFQRRVVQLNPDNSVTQLNLLDPGLLPYTSFNNATFPASDPAIATSAPAVGSPGYADAILAFVRQHAPDTFGNLAVRFFTTFRNTVPLAVAYPSGGGSAGLLLGVDLEMWGVPTSRPAADPHNANFVYQRFQRGIMHFDAACNCTQGILLGDYFKSVISGQNLPADLAAEAASSPYLKQYDNSKPNGLRNPAALPGTNLANAFEKQAPLAPPTGINGLRYGFAVYMPFQDQPRIIANVKGAGFGWIKQQIRWADMEPSKGDVRFYLMDPIADTAAVNGVGVLFSITSTPPWARADGRTNGPPDNLNDLGDFVAALANRYQGNVQAYEIWNEQNFSREWGGGTINAGAYVRMLRVAYGRIKAADPSAVVLAGALTPTGVNDPNVAIDDAAYMAQMEQYASGAFKGVADAVGVHVAGYNNGPDDDPGHSSVGTPGFKDHMSFYYRRIDDLHDVMTRYGDGRQVWVTEYEWGSAQPPVPAGYEWTTQLSEAQVGDFIVQGIREVQQSRPWVGALFVFNLNLRVIKDYHTAEEAIFGVLNPDWSPRSIYRKLAAMPK